MLEADDALDSVEPVRDKECAAADRDQCNVTGLRFKPIDVFLDHLLRAFENAIDHVSRQVGNLAPVAEFEQPGCDRDVGTSHLFATKYQRVLGEPEANALRANRERVWIDVASAAEADRDEVGHTEKRAHSADRDSIIGLTWEPTAQVAEVGGGSADIDHNSIGPPRKVGGPAHRIGRAGCEAVDRQRARMRRGSNRAVVLSDVERRIDTAEAYGCLKAAYCLRRERDKRRVEKRRILALEQADAAQEVRPGDGYPGDLLQQNFRSPLFVVGIERREHRGDRGML